MAGEVMAVLLLLIAELSMFSSNLLEWRLVAVYKVTLEQLSYIL